MKRRRLLMAGGGAAALTLMVAAGLFAGASTTVQQARADAPASKLFAYVVPTTPGPLRACSPDVSDCTTANEVWHFIYVANENRLQNFTGFSTRATLQNSFVVSSVDLVGVFVNGVLFPDSPLRFTPPLETLPFLAGSGHWPATVTCQGAPGAFQRPCNVVGNPAVVPGERTAMFYAGWIHTTGEPNGLYVFKYTVHGTLNGAPVDLAANSPPILMAN